MCQFFAIGLFVRGVRCVLRTVHVCVSLKLSMWNDEKNHSDFHHSCIHQILEPIPKYIRTFEAF